jgi:L,D-peptidoglycan transpeptidase YkuD (ErfK/YbiS/YcfS/YnhG family)
MNTKQENILVYSSGRLLYRGKEYRCALGGAGVRADKKEGDMATPEGCFLLREVYYRPDRIKELKTKLPASPLSQSDGWCDDPKDHNYNKPVKLPYAAGHERLWRDDNIYDLIIVIGYNDSPVISGKGSAIFLHIARPEYSPTAGCVAVSLPDMLEILKTVDQKTKICIKNEK